MPITLERRGATTTLSMAMPRGNAIHFAFIEAVNAALDELERSPPGALVIVSQGKAFCGGLDLIEAYDYDRATLRGFVDAFEGMFLRLFTLGRPVVAAVAGHAIAGGCILAMTADVRVFGAGSFVVSLNEVELGIPFPSGALEIARAAVPPLGWTEWFLEGRRFSPAEASAGHVAHALVEGAPLEPALERAARLAERPAEALAAIKAALRAPAVARAHADAEPSRQRFLEAWYAPAAREKIGALRAALVAKR
jgi:enoyl-CoA hydratase